MPPVSQAQAKLMFAVASGKAKKPGLKRSVAKEFANATTSVKSLPKRKKK